MSRAIARSYRLPHSQAKGQFTSTCFLRVTTWPLLNPMVSGCSKLACLSLPTFPILAISIAFCPVRQTWWKVGEIQEGISVLIHISKTRYCGVLVLGRGIRSAGQVLLTLRNLARRRRWNCWEVITPVSKRKRFGLLSFRASSGVDGILSLALLPKMKARVLQKSHWKCSSTKVMMVWQ